MNIVVDTSVIIAVVTNEESKAKLVELTKGIELICPYSLHWEVGNAISAMFKRKRIDLITAKKILEYYQQIPIRFIDVDLSLSLELASTFKIYAYDAYFLACALSLKSPLLSLDKELIRAAKKLEIQIKEV
jgi:predicted nucleic acid-binding protein